MAETSLTQLIEDALNQKNLQLPVFNRVALLVQQMIAGDDYSGDELGALIQQDQALAAHILRVANSSFYSGLVPVKTVKDAAFRLGARNLASMSMAITQKQMYRARVKLFKVWMGDLWKHALGTAVASKWLAENLGFNSIAEEAFMAGLLHDIGKLLLIRIIDELIVRKEVQGRLSANLVQEILESMHTDIGQRYLVKLNMPQNYSIVAGLHHGAKVSKDNPVLNLVRLSNVTCHKLGIGLKNDPDIMLSTLPEAINLMAKDIILAELQVTLEDLMESVDQLV